MSELAKHTWESDTWALTEQDCPDCGDSVSSNGRVRKCVDVDCDWWEVIEDG